MTIIHSQEDLLRYLKDEPLPAVDIESNERLENMFPHDYFFPILVDKMGCSSFFRQYKVYTQRDIEQLASFGELMKREYDES